MVGGRHRPRVQVLAYRVVGARSCGSVQRWRWGFALTRDGSIMAYNTSNSAPIIKLVETETGNEIAELEAPDASPLMWLSFNSDGSQIVATTSHEIQLWDLRAIRRGLSQIGLDWNQPPYPPASEPAEAATIEVKVINP